MRVIASLLEPNRGRTTCYVNKKATFDQRMRYCSRFIGSLALFNVFIVRLVTPLTTFYTQAKTKAVWRHITIVLFSLMVEDRRLLFVGMK